VAALPFLSVNILRNSPALLLNSLLSRHPPSLKLPQAKISVFNIYRPPSSSAYSVRENTILCDLSFAATTPHEFIITGDFYVHLDNHTDHLTSQLLPLVSSFNLTLSTFLHTTGITLSTLSFCRLTLLSHHLSPSLSALRLTTFQSSQNCRSVVHLCLFLRLILFAVSTP